MLEKFLKSKDYITLALATKTSRQFLKIAFIEHLKLTNLQTKNNSNSNKNFTRKNTNKKRTLKNITRKHHK